jgi:hypothetical protein
MNKTTMTLEELKNRMIENRWSVTDNNGLLDEDKIHTILCTLQELQLIKLGIVCYRELAHKIAEEIKHDLFDCER